MFTPSEFERIAGACSNIANDASDEFGFVSVRSLLKRFDAALTVRPLLVEAMLAFSESTVGSSRPGQWTVFLDSETYSIDEQDIAREKFRTPLPDRLRNTIAHELVHSIAFRFSEFGIELKLDDGGNQSQDKFVRAIEAVTERLSPLLLWPEKAFTKCVGNPRSTVTVEDYDAVRESLGLSRYVLIARLQMLSVLGPRSLLLTGGIRNSAVGIGEWASNGEAVLRQWPLFFNFESGDVPTFFYAVSREDRMPARSIFNDESFAMLGGTSSKTQIVTTAGTNASPTARQVRVECAVGTGKRAPGSSFLYVVRQIS